MDNYFGGVRAKKSKRKCCKVGRKTRRCEYYSGTVAHPGPCKARKPRAKKVAVGDSCGMLLKAPGLGQCAKGNKAYCASRYVTGSKKNRCCHYSMCPPGGTLYGDMDEPFMIGGAMSGGISRTRRRQLDKVNPWLQHMEYVRSMYPGY